MLSPKDIKPIIKILKEMKTYLKILYWDYFVYSILQVQYYGAFRDYSTILVYERLCFKI